jgi:hypothetical protein
MFCSPDVPNGEITHSTPAVGMEGKLSLIDICKADKCFSSFLGDDFSQRHRSDIQKSQHPENTKIDPFQ